jgi:hypothetical protein
MRPLLPLLSIALLCSCTHEAIEIPQFNVRYEVICDSCHAAYTNPRSHQSGTQTVVGAWSYPCKAQQNDYAQLSATELTIGDSVTINVFRENVLWETKTGTGIPQHGVEILDPLP